jgi:molybdate transport system substrate-binding protein
MAQVLQELRPAFEDATGDKFIASFDVSGPLIRRIESGEAFDTIIATPNDIEQAKRSGKLLASVRVDIAKVGIGIWIRDGALKPDIGTIDSLKRMLRDADSISYTKESAAGQHLAALMERLGLAEEMKPKTTLLGGGGQNPRAVAAGRVQYGMSIIADGYGLSGVELLGLLPEEVQKWIMFVGSIAVDAQDVTAARQFLEFLTSNESAAVMKAHGFQMP